MSLIAPSYARSPSAESKKANIRTKTAQHLRDFVEPKRSLIHPLQSNERDGRICTATTQASTDRNIFRHANVHVRGDTRQLFIGAHRLHDKVGFIFGRAWRGEFKSACRRQPDLIPPIDGLKDRPEFMIAIIAPPKNAQIQINFRERSQ